MEILITLFLGLLGAVAFSSILVMADGTQDKPANKELAEYLKKY